jgi:hypothetical protein
VVEEEQGTGGKLGDAADGPELAGDVEVPTAEQDNDGRLASVDSSWRLACCRDGEHMATL